MDAGTLKRVPQDLAAALAAHEGSFVAIERPGNGDRPTAVAPPSAEVPWGIVVPSPWPSPRRTGERGADGGAEGVEVSARADAGAAAPGRGAAGGDAESEYAAAEDLMRAGDTARARLALLALVARHEHDPRVELALLDLARLALTGGQPAEARGFLARLTAATRDPVLLDLAGRLRCRVDVAEGKVSRVCP
jgi:hypothetical protein